MKNILELEDEIRKIVESCTNDIELTRVDHETEEEIKDKLQVFVGAIPREDLDTLAPCAVVTTLKGTNSLDEKRLNTIVSLAIYNKDTRKGYEEIYNLLEIISKTLIEKAIVLDEYEVLPEYKWELPEVQPYPIHGIDITFNILARNTYRRDVDVWEE
ncbi:MULTISPECIES: hypothetical protein [unclassified Fusobacterium]|uniref:hypothetical protein n=1 Tax=unclassified Fusobacterium TaxID=2648384 RepID=UPI001B8BE0F5|nr:MULTISPECIES: hypothetical protein [unclassified Fusobacterium]MBR8701157.1 hypothetical protein [Fusobacterium sp. DD45]MBR8711330.1 hypothetical protein [Fusobacterium sp. DD28]MBR8751879.1 hypothetical protein [Fusobacterium sp. DD26]